MDRQDRPTPRSELKRFKHKVIVAGSRGYNDYDGFKKYLEPILKNLFPDVDPKDIVFITGKAKSGPDDMIIRWCRENGREWMEYEADWNNLDAPGAIIAYNKRGMPYNKRAGMDRNWEMAEDGTDLIVWWDLRSPGTEEMIKAGKKKGILRATVYVNKDEEDGRQPQSSGASHSDLDW